MAADPRSTVASVASAPNPTCTRIGAVEATLPRRPPERSTSASATADAPVRAHGSARRHAARGSRHAVRRSHQPGSSPLRRRSGRPPRSRDGVSDLSAGNAAAACGSAAAFWPASAFQSGSRSMTCARISETSSPANARRPVSISKSTQPKAQMSARLSTARPSCLLRAHVRRGAEDHARVRHRRRGDRRRIRSDPASRRCRDGSIAFASPKSSTLTVPSGRTLMLAGLRSRWMMPCSCAASSASAICRAIGSASSSGMAALRDAVGERRLRRPVP